MTRHDTREDSGARIARAAEVTEVGEGCARSYISNSQLVTISGTEYRAGEGKTPISDYGLSRRSLKVKSAHGLSRREKIMT